MTKLIALASSGVAALWLGFFEAVPGPVEPAETSGGELIEVDGESFRIDYRVDVLLVELDVSVHDRRGDLISGLSREDFHLFEDGVEVPISHFEEIVEKPISGAEPGSGASEGGGRRFLVFVDTYLASTRRVLQVRRALARFLDSALTPSDRLSLAILGRHGTLEVLPRLARAGARERAEGILPPLARNQGALRNTYEEARHVLESVERAVQAVLAASAPAPRSLIFISPGFVPARPEPSLSVGEIAEIIRILAPPGVGPGRGRLDPFNPWDPENRRFRGPVSEAGKKHPDRQPKIEVLLGSLAGWLNARNITLYAINCGDRGPLDLFATASITTAGPPVPGAPAMPGLSMLESLKLNMLDELSELTGGLAWLHTRGYRRAFHRIDQATAHYYRLGFRPKTDRPRGRYHRLKVKVDRRRARLRYPRGYLDS